MLPYRTKKNGIIHVVGSRKWSITTRNDYRMRRFTQVHGAVGAIAFGIGTSEVEMVLATQCIFQAKPKTMRITIDGTLNEGVTAKDMALYLISKLTTGGATGYL